MNQKFILLAALFISAVLTYGLVVYLPQLPVATGYAAKKMCSCTFISGRPQQSIQEDDLGFGPLSLTSTRIDHDKQEVVSSIFGLAKRKATYRGGVGCVLIQGDDDYNISMRLSKPSGTQAVWPLGDQVQYASPPDVDVDALDEAILSYFDPSLEMDSIKTRAIVVVHRGEIVAEQYAHGFTPETEILGWSMTKSITSALIGIMVKNGLMSLDDSALFPQWDDQRSEISLRDLLQMQSGLEFEETYENLSDATQMLYKSENSGAVSQLWLVGGCLMFQRVTGSDSYSSQE